MKKTVTRNQQGGNTTALHFSGAQDLHREIALIMTTPNETVMADILEGDGSASEQREWLGATVADVDSRRYSWQEAAAELAQMPELSGPIGTAKTVKRWSDYDGDDMSMERYYDGMPFLAQRRKIHGARQRRVVRVLVNIAENCHTTADQMKYKAYAAARLVDQIHATGNEAEVVIAMYAESVTTRNPADRWTIKATVKRAGEPLNIALLCTMMAPWTLRRWGFIAVRQHVERIRSSLGRATAVPEHERNGAIVIDKGQCLSKAEAEYFIKQVRV